MVDAARAAEMGPYRRDGRRFRPQHFIRVSRAESHSARRTAKFLDVHLMIVSPENYVARFAEAGADLVTFHLEATDDPAGCVALIRRGRSQSGRVDQAGGRRWRRCARLLPLGGPGAGDERRAGVRRTVVHPGVAGEDRAAAGDGPGDGSRNESSRSMEASRPANGRSGLRGGRRRAGGRQQRFRSRRSAGRGREDAQRLTGAGPSGKSAGDFISEKNTPSASGVPGRLGVEQAAQSAQERIVAEHSAP